MRVYVPSASAKKAKSTKPQLTITSLPVGRKRKDTFPVKPVGRAAPVYVTQLVCPGSWARHEAWMPREFS